MASTNPIDHEGDVERRRPEEETPLLGYNSPISVAPSRGDRTKIIGLAMSYLIIVEVGSYLQIPPSYQLLEDIICRKHFPGRTLSDVDDDFCKTPEVQGELAMIKGWQASLDCVAPLLTLIPYGVIADKYGRRPVLSLAMLGITLELLWQLQPLLFPEVLPPWTIWIGSAFQFIGGGVGMVNAMIWTIISDVVPVSNLTAVYYRVGATVMVGELVVVPLSAMLLTKNPWLPLTLSMVFLIIGTCIPPLMPETLNLRRAANQEVEQSPDRNEDGAKDKRTLREQIVFSVKNDISHVYNFLTKSRKFIVLLLSFTLTVVVKYTKIEIMSQYVHNIFHWSWAKSTLLGTVSTITNMAMLLAVLPGLSWLITKRTGMHPLLRDLWLTRMTSVLLTIGCLMVAIAFAPWFMICALVIFSMGSCYTSISRAMLNALVEPQTIGTLNTIITWVEMISMLVASPIISGLLKAGNAAGGAWVGLPFFAATIMALGGTAIVFTYRVPEEKLRRATQP